MNFSKPAVRQNGQALPKRIKAEDDTKSVINCYRLSVFWLFGRKALNFRFSGTTTAFLALRLCNDVKIAALELLACAPSVCAFIKNHCYGSQFCSGRTTSCRTVLPAAQFNAEPCR